MDRSNLEVNRPVVVQRRLSAAQGHTFQAIVSKITGNVTVGLTRVKKLRTQNFQIVANGSDTVGAALSAV